MLRKEIKRGGPKARALSETVCGKSKLGTEANGGLGYRAYPPAWPEKRLVTPAMNLAKRPLLIFLACMYTYVTMAILAGSWTKI